jgi:hypothetical protein
MNVSVDLCVVPVGLEGSLAPWVAICHGADSRVGAGVRARARTEQRLRGIGMLCLLALSAVMSACMGRGCRGFTPRFA